MYPAPGHFAPADRFTALVEPREPAYPRAVSEWSKNVISCAAYEDGLLSAVGVHVAPVLLLAIREAWTREEVIASIRRGKHFYTVAFGRGGKWEPGPRIGIFRLDGMPFLKTGPSSNAEDDLGELPTC